jgi:hypothetical protein
VASQDLLGQAWPRALGGRDVLDESRRHERPLWVHQPEPVPVDRRPPPPSARMAACHMPRRHFLAVAIAWGALIATLLAVVLAVRWLG